MLKDRSQQRRSLDPSLWCAGVRTICLRSCARFSSESIGPMVIASFARALSYDGRAAIPLAANILRKTPLL
jgi:hypothetical protein